MYHTTYIIHCAFCIVYHISYPWMDEIFIQFIFSIVVPMMLNNAAPIKVTLQYQSHS